MKHCSRCGKLKDEREFSKNITCLDGLQRYCKTCSNEITIEYNDKNPKKRKETTKKYRNNNDQEIKENANKYRNKNRDVVRKRVKNSALKRKYGITLEQKNQMVIDQNGLCASCGDPLGIDPNNICVDHCHETNQVRKILCRKCNWALGAMSEDPVKILGLLNYAKYCNDLRKNK
jgi:hypothetical protein